MTTTIKKGLAVLASLAVSFFSVMPAGAAVLNSGGSSLGGVSANSLGGLIVLDGLFDGNNQAATNDTAGNTTDGNVSSISGVSRLGELIVLSNLFSNGSSGSLLSSGGSRTVTVQSGDTLSSIAAQFLGNASLWTQIASANGLVSPYTIRPGQQLVIPSGVGSMSGVGGAGTGAGPNSLGGLLVLDSLFGSGNANSANNSGISRLGELIVLSNLFGNGNGLF